MNLRQKFAGKREKVLATPTEEIRHHDHDDEDWIQIGQNGFENELVLETNSPNLEEDVHEIFTSDVNDPMEELHLIEVIPLFRDDNNVCSWRGSWKTI